MYSDKLEKTYNGELAKEVQALSKEEKSELDWATKQFLALNERVSICKETVLEWDIYKFKCKPFTLGLFKDLYGIISPMFLGGNARESEIFADSAALILTGETKGSEGFLRSGFVEDVLSVDGTDVEKYQKADEIMGAVSFFSIHYWRFGEKLKNKNPQVVEKKRRSPKSPKAAK